MERREKRHMAILQPHPNMNFVHMTKDEAVIKQTEKQKKKIQK
jgi:hypothetical protein